jgi:hypothetical protein
MINEPSLRIGGCFSMFDSKKKYPWLVLSLMLEPYNYYELREEEIANGLEEDVSKQSRSDEDGIKNLIEFLN